MRARHHNHRVMRNRSAWPKKAAIAHPSVSQFSGTRGCRIKATPARPMATIGANRAIPSEASMIIPRPGIILMSNDEKRIDRNISQTAAQIARQTIDAVRNEALSTLMPNGAAGSVFADPRIVLRSDAARREPKFRAHSRQDCASAGRGELRASIGRCPSLVVT